MVFKKKYHKQYELTYKKVQNRQSFFKVFIHILSNENVLNKFRIIFKVRGYVTGVKWWTFKVYSISTRLPVNNHQSFFFY